MTEKKTRVGAQRVYGKDFVDSADGLGLNLTNVRRAWKQVIRHIKNAPTRSTEEALADYATYAQLKALRDASERPVKGLSDETWELFKKVAWEFVAGM